MWRRRLTAGSCGAAILAPDRERWTGVHSVTMRRVDGAMSVDHQRRPPIFAC